MKTNLRPLCYFLLGVAVPAPVVAQERPADMILHSGRVWTGEDAQPWAQAVAIRGNQIVAVGADQEILALRGEGTRVVDLDRVVLTIVDGRVTFERPRT